MAGTCRRHGTSPADPVALAAHARGSVAKTSTPRYSRTRPTEGPDSAHAYAWGFGFGYVYTAELAARCPYPASSMGEDYSMAMHAARLSLTGVLPCEEPGLDPTTSGPLGRSPATLLSPRAHPDVARSSPLSLQAIILPPPPTFSHLLTPSHTIEPSLSAGHFTSLLIHWAALSCATSTTPPTRPPRDTRTASSQKPPPSTPTAAKRFCPLSIGCSTHRAAL